MPTFDDWSAQLRLADFDRLVDGMSQWVESSPPWPPFDRARAVWARIAPRVEQLRVDLDRVWSSASSVAREREKARC